MALVTGCMVDMIRRDAILYDCLPMFGPRQSLDRTSPVSGRIAIFGSAATEEIVRQEYGES